MGEHLKKNEGDLTKDQYDPGWLRRLISEAGIGDPNVEFKAISGWRQTGLFVDSIEGYRFTPSAPPEVYDARLEQLFDDTPGE